VTTHRPNARTLSEATTRRAALGAIIAAGAAGATAVLNAAARSAFAAALALAAITAPPLAAAPAAAAEYKTLAFALATVEGAQQTCGFHANLGVIASLAAIRVPDADEAAFENEVNAQVRAIGAAIAARGATSWCLEALRRLGPHGVDMPGLLTGARQ
jgi:hypothetical protein